MNDRNIEETMGVALVCNNISPIPSKISSHMKKKWLVAAKTLFDSWTESVPQEW